MRKILTVLLCLTLAVMCCPAALAAEERAADKIVVLFTNDVHAGINADETTFGYADLNQYKTEIAALTKYVTLVDCGDAVQGEVIATLSKGASIVEVMNAVGYDVCTLGNHEFDYGIPQLMALIGQANAEYVCCNFTDADVNALLDAYKMIEYDGLKIAYVGVVTPYAFTSSSPRHFMNDAGEFIYGFCEGNEGRNLHAVVQSAVNAARAAGADHVVLLSHLGFDGQTTLYSSIDLIANTTGIDVVLDGHAHAVIPGETYPNKDGKSVLISSTGTKLAHIGQLVIDTQGTHDPSDDTFSTSLIDKTGYDAVAGKIAAIESENEAMMNAVVAATDVELTIAAENGNRLVRCRETNLGDFCADAFRVVSGADAAIVNGGGVRAALPQGDITNAQMIAVHPFGNMLCVVEATGQEILDALELGVSKTMSVSETEKGAVGENGGFYQVSGLQFTVNAGIPTPVVRDDANMLKEIVGERRVTDARILDSKTGEYAPLDPAKTYSLASTNYTLKGYGDGNNVFADNVLLQNDVMLDYQVLITYADEFLGGHIGEQYAATAGRITVK